MPLQPLRHTQEPWSDDVIRYLRVQLWINLDTPWLEVLVASFSLHSRQTSQYKAQLCVRSRGNPSLACGFTCEALIVNLWPLNVARNPADFALNTRTCASPQVVITVVWRIEKRWEANQRWDMKSKVKCRVKKENETNYLNTFRSHNRWLGCATFKKAIGKGQKDLFLWFKHR